MTACLTSALFMTACNKDKVEVDNRPTIEGVSFVEDEVKKGPQFLEGALEVVERGSTIMLNEYVDFVSDPYTLTITDSEGNVTDLSSRSYWMADVIGEYVFTYKISSGEKAGTSTFKLTVKNPDLEWQFSLQNTPYNFGDEIVFSEYFGAMNIVVPDFAEEDYEIFMESVEVDGETVPLRGADSYVFESRSDHTFKFCVEANDGQRLEARQVVSIKYVDADYLQELTDMGISLNGDLYVERGGFTMVEGSYCNGNNVILRRSNGPHYSPYVAYEGEYGIGSYVKVDFTGKNMPIFSFFRDKFSASMFDGSKGILFTGGLKNNNGAPGHPTLTLGGFLYGPNMLNKPDEAFCADFRDTAYLGDSVHLSDGNPHPISLQGLKDGTHYRMIIGFSGIEETSANHLFTKEPTSSIRLVLECVLIDLDSKQVATKFTMRTYALQALGFENVIPTDLENNEYFKGSIVLYGNYGERTVWDNLYPIITNTEDSFDEIFADELSYSRFNSGAKTTAIGTSCEVRVSDYVDTTKDGYIFYYVDGEGVRHDVEGDTFTLSASGSYIFYYSDGENLCASLPFNLIEVSSAVNEWISSSGISLHGMESITDDRSVVLKSGTIGGGASYTGPNPGLNVDQSYIAFDGNYSFDDYVAFDFTGKNMPEVAFFAQNYNNSMYYQDGGKHGIVFANGITMYNGEINTGVLEGSTAVNIDSPFMIEGVNDSWYKMGGDVISQLARANLVDGTKYRVILGFTKGSSHGANGITLNWALYNRETNELIERGQIETYNFYTGQNERVNYMTLNDLFGSIVIYGKFGTTLTIDKLHGVFEDTTIEALANGLNGDTSYTVTFKNASGRVLKTVEDVPFGETVVYGEDIPSPEITEDAAFTYEYAWDKAFGPISQDTTYSLKTIATPKSNVKTYNSSIGENGFIINPGTIGAGADYVIGQNRGGSIDQSYIAIDGEFGVGTFISFDFTGKNMPEVMFFAKNYDESMYYSDGKQGVVIASGITYWNGEIGEVQSGNTKVGVSGPFGAYIQAAEAPYGGNMMLDFEAQLARANLVDGKQYRVIIGITRATDSRAFSLEYMLYNLTDGVVVEKIAEDSWNFYTGSHEAVSGLTIDDLVGSIVLYGKFSAEVKIDAFNGVFEDSSLDDAIEVLFA